MIIPWQWQQFQKLGNQWVFIFVNCIREIRLGRIPKTRGLSLTSTFSRCNCLNFPAGLTHPSSSPAPRENEDSSPSHSQTEVGTGWQGFPGGSNGKESTCNSGELGLIPGLGKIAWRRAWQPTPVFLPEESHGQRSLVGYSPWTHKESDTTEWLRTTRKASGRTVNCNTLNLLL